MSSPAFQENNAGVSLSIIRDGYEHKLTADHIVLSAGVYGTPETLQRSGVGDPELLQQLDIPVRVPSFRVGMNLHGHPMVRADRSVGPQLRQWPAPIGLAFDVHLHRNRI